MILRVREYRFVRRGAEREKCRDGWRVAGEQIRAYAERVRVARALAGAPHYFDADKFRRIYPDSRCTVLLERDA